MKITINENESYDINFPELVSKEEFFAIKLRLDTIVKLLGKDPLLQLTKEMPKTPSVRNPHAPIEQRPWDQSRKNAIELVRVHYFGIDEEKQAYEKISGRVWRDIYKRVSGLKERWNIQPKDIGLTRWPTVKEMWGAKELEHLKIQNGTKTETEEKTNAEVEKTPIN